MKPAISAVTAARLIIGVRLRRLLNRLSALRAGRTRPGGAPARVGTAGKREGGLGLGLVIVLALGWTAVSATTDFFAKVMRLHAPGWSAGDPLPWAALSCFTVEAGLLLLAVILLALANKELAAAQWDLEWLATLPSPLRTLLGVRIAERALINPTGLLVLAPFLATMAWKMGHGWVGLLVGPLVALPLLAMAGALEALVDTGLRLRVPPHRLRNLQALFTITGSVLFYLALAQSMGGRELRFPWIAQLPPWFSWTPPGLAVGALVPGTPALIKLACLMTTAALLVLAVYHWLQRQLAQGVAAAGVRESARHLPRDGGAPAARWRLPILSPLLARELRLLARDRNFMVQTMVMPLLIVGFQLFLSTGRDKGGLSLSSIGFDHLAALGFGIASYTLMFSAFQTLNSEGKALWLLFTFPRRLEDVLGEKARLWGLVALTYPLALFAAAAVARGGLYPDELPGLLIALCGVPIYGVIATSLGVFGADPLAQEAQRKIRPGYAYLYMLLASLFVYAIYATSWWQRLALLIITATLAVAMFQKARDRLPYLLDPSAAPPPAVSLADGMMAALLFMVLQGLVGLMLTRGREPPSGNQLLIAFVVAGAITALGTRIAQQAAKMRGIPQVLGAAWGRAVLRGLLVGLAAGAVGLGYVLLLSRLGDLARSLEKTSLSMPAPGPWLIVLAVTAAPIFEEIIFRGLVFGGLRRSMGFPAAALLSALIFAVVHPALGAAPVFAMALGAAWVYERSGMLLGPMMVHATYNAMVVGVHLLAR